MNIALAIEHFDAGQGGAEQYAWGLARWLAAQGHAVDVFTARAGAPADFVRAVQVLDAGGVSAARRPVALARALGEALRGRRYDVVHAFNHLWPCDVLRLGGGVHLAFEAWNARSEPTASGRWLKTLAHRVGPRYRALRENERRQFDDPRRRFIAVSRRVAADMERYYPACRGRVHLIHNGVDTDYFRPPGEEDRARARRDLQLADGELALLFVSNNYRLKGLHDLIRALPEVKAGSSSPVRVLIAGRGRIGPFLRQAERAGVRDLLQVVEGGRDMRPLYAAADVLVHPSYYDSFGFVGLEAMACGLPLVLSRNCGVSELLTDMQGAVLVDMPCDPAVLAAAIVRACDPAFRAAARSHNRRLAEQHPIEANYRKVFEVYERVRT